MKYNISKCPANILGLCIKHCKPCFECDCNIKELDTYAKELRQKYIELRNNATGEERLRYQPVIDNLTKVIKKTIKLVGSEVIND